jgi:hypothetical protein
MWEGEVEPWEEQWLYRQAKEKTSKVLFTKYEIVVQASPY